MSRTATQTDCTTCGKTYDSLGIMRHRTMHAEDRQRSTNGKLGHAVMYGALGTCPRCGHTGIHIFYDDRTKKPLRRICGQHRCNWQYKVTRKQS